MNSVLILVAVALAGVGLGVVFFGGLWWTVRQGLASNRPAVWFAVSLLVRVLVILAGFHFLSEGRWERLVACLVGFLIGRLVVTRFVRGLPGKLAVHRKEAGDAA